jgi:hypothetical protein
LTRGFWSGEAIGVRRPRCQEQRSDTGYKYPLHYGAFFLSGTFGNLEKCFLQAFSAWDTFSANIGLILFGSHTTIFHLHQ